MIGVPRHRVCDSLSGIRTVALNELETAWRPYRRWSPLDWFYLARTHLWARRTF